DETEARPVFGAALPRANRDAERLLAVEVRDTRVLGDAQDHELPSGGWRGLREGEHCRRGEQGEGAHHAGSVSGIRDQGSGIRDQGSGITRCRPRQTVAVEGSEIAWTTCPVSFALARRVAISAWEMMPTMAPVLSTMGTRRT